MVTRDDKKIGSLFVILISSYRSWQTDGGLLGRGDGDAAHDVRLAQAHHRVLQALVVSQVPEMNKTCIFFQAYNYMCPSLCSLSRVQHPGEDRLGKAVGDEAEGIGRDAGLVDVEQDEAEGERGEGEERIQGLRGRRQADPLLAQLDEGHSALGVSK